MSTPNFIAQLSLYRLPISATKNLKPSLKKLREVQTRVIAKQSQSFSVYQICFVADNYLFGLVVQVEIVFTLCSL